MRTSTINRSRVGTGTMNVPVRTLARSMNSTYTGTGTGVSTGGTLQLDPV